MAWVSAFKRTRQNSSKKRGSGCRRAEGADDVAARGASTCCRTGGMVSASKRKGSRSARACLTQTRSTCLKVTSSCLSHSTHASLFSSMRAWSASMERRSCFQGLLAPEKPRWCGRWLGPERPTTRTNTHFWTFRDRYTRTLGRFPYGYETVSRRSASPWTAAWQASVPFPSGLFSWRNFAREAAGIRPR